MQKHLQIESNNNPLSFVMPFGKYKGLTLDQIATSDEGLLYLDWCVGKFDDGYVKRIIQEYLSDSLIQKELDALLDDKMLDSTL